MPHTGTARPIPRIMLSVLCFPVLLVLAAGCDSGNGHRIVFSVGGTPSALLVWEELIANFEAQSDWRVTILRQPADTGQQLQALLVALDSGQDDPDVFIMDVAWVGLFAAAGWLRPLGTIDTEPFFEQVVEQVDKYNGKLLALPVYMDAGLLYYRKDLLKKYGYAGPPRRYEELTAMAVAVQKGERRDNPGFYGFVWQGAQYEGLVVNFLEFAGRGGGMLHQRNGRDVLDMTVPENRRGLTWMRDLIREHGISPPSTYTAMREEEVRLWFQQGNALFERNWPYAYALHDAPGSPVRGNVGVAMLPGWETDEPGLPTLGGWHIGISAQSDAPDGAMAFLRYVVSRGPQKRLALRLGWNPGREDLYDDPELLEKYPHLPVLETALEHARSRPLLPFYIQLSEIAQQTLNAALAGNIAPGPALRDMQSQMAALLARYGRETLLPEGTKTAGERGQ